MPALAQEVYQQARQRTGWVGQPLIVQYVYANVPDALPPALPPVDGLSFAVQPPNTSSSFQIVNGRQTSSSETTFPVAVTASRPGRFVIPAFDLQAGEHTWRTTPMELTFRAADDTTIMQADVTTATSKSWLGDVVPATLEIRVRPFRHQALPGGKLSMADTWRLIDAGTATWGPYAGAIEQMRSNRRMPATTTVPDGHGEVEWYVFTVPALLRPDRTGTVDMGDVLVRMDYPVDIGQSRDPFAGLTGRGSLRITRQRPVTATPEPALVQIEAPPMDGRPAEWTGAVGRFTFEVQGTPHTVDVGQPVTLRMTVTDVGDRPADMDTLSAPALHEVADLTDEFQIPADRPGGIVSGRSKTFTQSIRPVADTVDMIPPVPFSWFDPDTGTYVTAVSKPIPLTVNEGHTLTSTDLGAAPALNTAGPLTAVDGGLLANITDPDVLLHRPADASAVWMLAMAVVGPVCFAGAFTARRLRMRTASDPGRRRARGARQRASAAVAAAENDPAALADALRTLVMDRLDLTDGRSSAEVVQAMAERDADAANVLAAVLDELDRLTFAATGDTVPAEMIASVTTCVHTIMEASR
ncbi:MAG: BatD family protein [Phycisphaerales bacterium]|nr:BatD family protein [Phycisphaerales bacterium]